MKNKEWEEWRRRPLSCSKRIFSVAGISLSMEKVFFLENCLSRSLSQQEGALKFSHSKFNKLGSEEMRTFPSHCWYLMGSVGSSILEAANALGVAN